MAKLVQLRNIKRALKLEPNESANYLIGGRVSNFRVYKSHNFIDLIDGSTRQHLQVVVKKELLKKPELGSYLVCRGHITASRGAQQGVEFRVSQVELASKCDASKWPLAAAKQRQNNLTDQWYRRHLHLRPQAGHFAALLRVRSELELSLHMILKQMDFFKVQAPTLSSNDSEASSDLFMVQRSKQAAGTGPSAHHRRPAEALGGDLEGLEDDIDDDDDHKHELEERAVSDNGNARHEDSCNGTPRGTNLGGYFKKDVFLASSAQLHLESLAASLSRVYCLSAAFRAENSLSRRHLCEFTMLEAEEANVSRLEPLMDRVETIVKFAAQFLGDISESIEDFQALLDKYSNHDIYEKLARAPYIRMTYGEAMKVLQGLHAQPASAQLLSDLPLSACQHGRDISRRHERHLLNYCNNVPIFITNYPRELKPFYMKCSGEQALCFDLIAPLGGEICGGSLREDSATKLRANLRSMRRRQRQAVAGAGPSDQFRVDQRGGREDEDEAEAEAELNRNFQWYLDLSAPVASVCGFRHSSGRARAT